MKNTFKLFRTHSMLCAIALVALIGFSMIACPTSTSGDGNINSGETLATYSGGGYTLVITKKAARYTAQPEDDYVLTYLSNTSEGTVTAVSNGILTLKPNNSQETFTAEVSGSSINALSGRITWNDNTQSAPGGIGGNTFTRELTDAIYHYKPDGELNYYQKNEYDSNGQQTKTCMYHGDGELYSYTEYERTGNVTISRSYYNGVYNGYSESTTESEYDSNGYPKKSSYYSRSYDASGVLRSEIENRTEYEYSNGKLVNLKSSRYESGVLTEYSEIEFDSNGKQTKNRYYNGSGVLTGYAELEHDSNGNMTMRNYNASGVLTSYTVYEYNSNGNQTKLSHYNASGVLTEYSVYTYITVTVTLPPVMQLP